MGNLGYIKVLNWVFNFYKRDIQTKNKLGFAP